MIDSRTSIYSFEDYIEKHEIQESLDKRDDVRYSSAIYDTANRKISTTTTYPLLPIPQSGSRISHLISSIKKTNLHESLMELQEEESQSVLNGIEQNNKERMISAGFEYANTAKKAEDPLENFHLAGRLFDKAEIDDKAIKYYLKAIKPTNPVEIVDTRQLPMSDLEKKKLERMGKVQKVRYLKAREDKRVQLIEQEKAKQERRIQDSHCRLFRLLLHQAVNLIAPVTASEKASYGSQKEQREFDHRRNDLISRSHAHLRAAFRAIHPSRPTAYLAILKYADMILSAYLPPSSPEDGIYLHAASGSAGQLQEAHILVLQELLTFDDRDTDSLEQLGRRFAEKCQFEDARNFFKVITYSLFPPDPSPAPAPPLCLQRARDVHEAYRTPRYASSIPLMRHQGVDYDLLNQNKEMSTTMVPPNLSSTAIGTTLCRTHLMEGKKLALVKIPMLAFGEGSREDAVNKREQSDYTSFGGCHEGSETRVFLPPSIGWKRQLEIAEKVNQDMNHLASHSTSVSSAAHSHSSPSPSLGGVMPPLSSGHSHSSSGSRSSQTGAVTKK